MEWEREVLIYLLTDIAAGIRLGPSRQPTTPMWACVGGNSSELGLSSAAHLSLSLGDEFRELYYKETTSPWQLFTDVSVQEGRERSKEHGTLSRRPRRTKHEEDKDMTRRTVFVPGSGTSRRTTWGACRVQI